MPPLTTPGTLRDALSRATAMLAENGIADPPLEAVVLLAHALQTSRVQLYLDFDRPLGPEQSERFWRVVERRLKGEPAAYIIGRREFYKLDFYVDSSVLIPRPETELLVEKALELAKSGPISTIADIGTGCGAIAVALAVKLPQARIYAADISPSALKIAAANCEKHGVTERVIPLEGDLLAPLPEPVDLIVANLPYIRKADLAKVNTFGFEPESALDGGTDGLDVIRRLCSQLTQQTQKLRPGGHLLLEIGSDQREAVTALLHSAFPSARIESFSDLAGLARMVAMTLES